MELAVVFARFAGIAFSIRTEGRLIFGRSDPFGTSHVLAVVGSVVLFAAPFPVPKGLRSGV